MRSHVALKIKVKNDKFRSPEICILKGDFSHFFAIGKQHGIFFTWMPLFTMFSRGNISERSRILSMSFEGEVVLDLFAGIGYWAFPLVKRGAKVYCCEWNPASIEGLKRGAILNKISFTEQTEENCVNSQKMNSKGAVIEGERSLGTGKGAGGAVIEGEHSLETGKCAGGAVIEGEQSLGTGKGAGGAVIEGEQSLETGKCDKNNLCLPLSKKENG